MRKNAMKYRVLIGTDPEILNGKTDTLGRIWRYGASELLLKFYLTSARLSPNLP